MHLKPPDDAPAVPPSKGMRLFKDLSDGDYKVKLEDGSVRLATQEDWDLIRHLGLPPKESFP